MKRINLTEPSLGLEWSMQFMDKSHYDLVLKESTSVYKPDGSPLIHFLKNPFTPLAKERAYPVLKKIRAKTENRSTASGIKAVPRTKLNGVKSKVTRVPKGWEVMSGLVGFFERTPRMPYAHACSWNQKHPELFAEMFPILQEATHLFAKHEGPRYEKQMEFVKKTHPDFVIPGTAYTTITVNHNFRTACHLDAGDLAAGFSNMFVFRRGQFVGGELVLPNYRIAVDLQDGDLILFDAHEWHGNTQIIPLTEKYDRCSVVCYFREMLQCSKSKEEELQFAKNRKEGEALFPEKNR